MLGIGSTELVLILVFGFLLFGPEKAPQMARSIGRVIKQFRSASEEANKKIREDVIDPFQEVVDPVKDEVMDAVSPLKEEAEKVAKLKDSDSLLGQLNPIKDDMEAIQKGFKETQEAIQNPIRATAKHIMGSDDDDEKKPLQPSPRAKVKKATIATKSSSDDAASVPSVESLYGLDDEDGE